MKIGKARPSVLGLRQTPVPQHLATWLTYKVKRCQEPSLNNFRLGPGYRRRKGGGVKTGRNLESLRSHN